MAREIVDWVIVPKLARLRLRSALLPPLLWLSFCSSGCGPGEGGLVPALLGLGPSPQSGAATPVVQPSENVPAAGVKAAPAAPAPTANAPAPRAPSLLEAGPPVNAKPKAIGDTANEPAATDKLRALKLLHDRHLLSDSEYESRKQRVMGQSNR